MADKLHMRLAEMLDIKLWFLQFVNVPVNLLQLIIIRCAIEITIGCLRNVASASAYLSLPEY